MDSQSAATTAEPPVFDEVERCALLPDPSLQISAEDLKPFLSGLSPYGPRGWQPKRYAMARTATSGGHKNLGKLIPCIP
jgi:hypothetical protein